MRLVEDDLVEVINNGKLHLLAGKIRMKQMPEKKSQASRKAHTAGITAALIRAARRAHLIAHQAGTKIVVMRDGKVVEIEPDPEMYGGLLKGPPSTQTIFTIGHSNHPIEEFIGLLQRYGVNCVADVRSAPYSRHQPQFNREALKEALKARDITYVFLGRELGARSSDPGCYENGRVKYRLLAGTGLFRSGMERILRGGESWRMALMCAEKEPLECHRTILVARELVAAGENVSHIHPDGHLETHNEVIKRLLKLSEGDTKDFLKSNTEAVDDAYAAQEERIAHMDERLAPQA